MPHRSPINSSNIPGVHTGHKGGAGRKNLFGSFTREPEDQVEQKQEVEECGRVNLELCTSFELASGIECKKRISIKGLMFCEGNKENCPLRK